MRMLKVQYVEFYSVNFMANQAKIWSGVWNQIFNVECNLLTDWFIDLNCWLVSVDQLIDESLQLCFVIGSISAANVSS